MVAKFDQSQCGLCTAALSQRLDLMLSVLSVAV